MSKTASMYTIASAIVAAEKAFLGPDRDWRPINDMQWQFLAKVLGPARAELGHILELESIAALSEVPINEFLEKKGFSIKLDEFPKLTPPERAWGAASVLDLLMKWKVPGTKTMITTPDKRSFPAAKLSDDVVRIWHTGDTVVAQIATESSDVVYMAMSEKSVEYFELFTVVEGLLHGDRSYAPYEGLIFPMVDLDHEVDISWLKGLTVADDKGYYNRVTQALQQTKLKMNHIGARVKDAAAIGGIRLACMPNPPLVIDKPFLFWIMRPGLSRPLFAAHITQEHWKDPGSLDM